MIVFPLAVLPNLNLLIPPPFNYILAGVLGAIIGSFLNVVIHRLPLEESIVFPNSRCPSCGAAIAFYDNLPVLSYLMLRGRCRSCKGSISLRYPAVEILTAFLFVAVTWRDGFTATLPFDLVFVSAMVALVFIDAEYMILPNVITFPGIVFALATRVVLPYLATPHHFDDLPGLLAGALANFPLWAASLAGALFGALVGGSSLWLMGWIWEKLRGIELIGLGNVKMMFMVGAYLGWRLTILTVFLGVLSVIIIVPMLWLQRRDRDMQLLLPSGVFLGIGAIIALFFGSQIVNWYLGFYQ